MIGRNRLYRNLKTIFGIARQPTKQCESWPVIWKPFVVEANRKQWGLLSYYSGARPVTADYD